MSDEANHSKSRYIMVGGFLGAGKTTALNRFGGFLRDRGLKVGLITNDQGSGLVDSALGRSHEFPVEEISGGCFCCRFNSLVDAAQKLTTDDRPDVFLAEPVGSCTDLVATVSLPLRQIYGNDYAVAPLSVLVDPVRALRILGVEEGRKFSKNVLYIYRKQLEEAEMIVVNKTDLLDDARLAELEGALTTEFPHAEVFPVSARDGSGCEAWFERVLNSEIDVPRFLEIDYAKYGKGEALLGWLNQTIQIEHPGNGEFDGNALLRALADAMAKSLADAGTEVAHLKMTIGPIGDPFDIAAINLVRSDTAPELSHTLPDPIDDGELLLNIRAEAAPEVLDQVVSNALKGVIERKLGLTFHVTHSEHFRPGQPNPTHRIAPS